MTMKIINPKKWKKPIGYSNAIKTDGGNMVFLGGQVAFDPDFNVVGKGDLVAQFEQVMKNLATVMEAAGGTLQDIVKLTIFVQDKDDYLAKSKEIGSSYRWHFGTHYPAMTLVEISRFYEEDVLLEIEGIAVL